jgi:hypothetical protein
MTCLLAPDGLPQSVCCVAMMNTSRVSAGLMQDSTHAVVRCIRMLIICNTRAILLPSCSTDCCMCAMEEGGAMLSVSPCA